ncbi:MAG: AlwI family type II restriction endonuclease [Candidatus Dojkabacteria bacterium]|nr:MAG: AlwI family type II restriction endonuclease [Candidatus Dojkabacteria bacterium]
MAEVWSFNTTIRNPERLESLLRILSDMEGVIFDAQGQELFFSLQIKKRFYKPSRSTLGEELASAVFDSEQNEELDDSVVSSILDQYRGNVDSAGRGRTSVAVLNRFGLSIALQSHGPVIITPLGKKWLSGEIDDEELFTRFLLRWQYPNPIESGYTNYDIKPFPAVLQLINEVNIKWKAAGNNPVGISKDEYRLFALSLHRQSDIVSAAEQIIELRRCVNTLVGTERSDYINRFTQQRVIGIFGDTNDEPIRKHISNLKDYTDSSLRYFRTSGLITLRGAGRYIDIAVDKKVEVDSILNDVSLESIGFTEAADYLAYLGDLSYELPWQNEEDLQRISENLMSVLESEVQETTIEFDSSTIHNKTLPQKVSILKGRINQVRIEKLRSLKHDLEVLDEAIEKLSSITSPRYEIITSRPSLDLEWYVSRALMVINDAIRIDPSFKVGDDGVPTGFRGKISDIECEYTSFGLTVEVTLIKGRDQWYAEGQPVMRHLRDFEDTLPEGKEAYCVFIAPHIHRDTLNQFWTSNKYEFEGRRQKIIPISIGEFVDFLHKAREMIQSSTLDHSALRELLNNITLSVDTYSDSIEWQSNIHNTILGW